jgi:hypothetical protein
MVSPCHCLGSPPHLVYLKILLCPTWRVFHVWHSGRVPAPPSDLVCELGVRRTGLVAAAGPGTRSQLVATVPSLPRRPPLWTSAYQFWPELVWKLGQFGASGRTPLVAWQRWHGSPPIGGIACPPHWRWVDMRCSGPRLQQPWSCSLDGWRREPLPWLELGWRHSPPLGFSLPRARAHAMATHVARPQQLLACQRACSAIAPPPTRCWVAKNGLALIAPPDEHVNARWGGRCPAVVPPPVVKPSSWSEWLEHSPSMVCLWQE